MPKTKSGPGEAFRRRILPRERRRYSKAGRLTRSAGRVPWSIEFPDLRVTALGF